MNAVAQVKKNVATDLNLRKICNRFKFSQDVEYQVKIRFYTPQKLFSGTKIIP
jgi:hypothetical protein